MCLSVTHVPATMTDGLIVPCWKSILVTRDGYQSMVRETPIPQQGWIKARRPMTSRANGYYAEDVIGASGVHAYETQSSGGFRVRAYAFGVIGYENVADWWAPTELVIPALAAEYLYIPICDTSGTRIQTVAKINRILARKTITRKAVIAINPKLLGPRLAKYAVL